ncbi:MAG: hypothetical protein IKF83_03085 [Clostridia bacterium]|nr:hypothetical protein [Clostridia bacterium]
MNQILTTKAVRPKKTVPLKTVIVFFGISMIIFGICMVTSGSYAMYKSASTRTSKKTQNTSQNNTTQTSTNSNIQIHLAVEGSNIKATVVGETEIDFVTYKWDEEEETTEAINNVSGEIEIEIPSGEHTLTVTAVDINNNEKTETRPVKGVTKPKLEVTQDGSEFVIDASDEIGLDRFEFILNGKGYLVRVEGEKEKQFRYPLEEGDNTLEVTAYNTEGATEQFKAICHN